VENFFSENYMEDVKKQISALVSDTWLIFMVLPLVNLLNIALSAALTNATLLETDSSKKIETLIGCPIKNLCSNRKIAASNIASIIFRFL